MNDNQTRALWATALNDLAEMINRGAVRPPTSISMYTQWVTAEELLGAADHAADKSLPIRITAGVATVTIPTGKLLDLPIQWVIQVRLPFDRPIERTEMCEAFRLHNAECVDASPTMGAGNVNTDDQESLNFADEG